MGTWWLVGPAQQQRAGAHGADLGRGGGTLTVYSAYAPTSGNTSAARQAFYDDVSVQTRSENQSDVLALFIDGNASMGVGARPGTWERDKRRAVAQRAAEIAERRAVFDANNNN